MKIKNLLFISLAGFLSLVGCNDAPKDETPAGEQGGGSEGSGSGGSSESGGEQGGSESGGEQGGGSEEIVPPTVEEQHAIAKAIKEFDFSSIDPAEDILGKKEVEKIKRDTPIYTTDRLGGTCVEEEDYYVWKNLPGVQNRIAQEVVGQCGGFSESLFEMLDMFRQCLPDDAEFNKPIHVVQKMQVSATEFADIPLDFYLKGSVNDYTFYFGIDMPEMGVNEHDSFRFTKDEDGQFSYEYRAASINHYYDYMPLCLHNEPNDQDFLHYDTANKRYNLHNRTDGWFYIRQIGTGLHLPLVLESGSEAYGTLSDDQTVITLKTDNPVDYYFFENTDGKLHVDIHPTDGTSDVGNTQRFEDVKGTMCARWKPGEYYEKVVFYDAPVYAIGRFSNSFFKAQKNDKGQWVVYNRSSFDGEFIAYQSDLGWYMITQLSREDDTGEFKESIELHVANSQAYDIAQLDTRKEAENHKQFVYLTAFDGWDEIREYNKEDVHAYCRYTINNQETGKYYESMGADLYNNGTKVFESGDFNMGQEFLSVGGKWSYEVSSHMDGDYSNREVYGAYLGLNSALNQLSSVMESLHLECKYGNLTDILNGGVDFIDHIDDYVGLISLYGLNAKTSRLQFWELAYSLFSQFDISAEIDALFGSN